MVDAGLTVIQDSIGSATPENTGELIKFSHANNNNNRASFRTKRGYETAILEAKLEMQWEAFNATPYFQIFLDLAKAYDSIDR